MANPYIHHFDQLLKELETDIGKLNVLMHQAYTMVETIRGKHIVVNKAYEKWREVNKI